jgi:hypothetical protein
MKNLFLILLLIGSSSIIKAQDTLSMRSGENILVKVIEVGTSEVKYKKLDNINGPLFSILKSDLLTIKYENGTKEDFSNIKTNSPDLFMQGQNDAIINYKGYKTAGTSVLVTTAFPGYGIFIGIAPALICASSEPLDENLGYPDMNLMKNELYAKGYKQKAKQIKTNKVIHNYLSGVAIQGAYILALFIGLAAGH